MLRRIEGDERRGATLGELLGLRRSEPVVAAIPEAEFDTALLPRDHPPWVKDTLSVSQRARELIERLRPIVMRVMTFWDHRLRSSSIGGTRIAIDPSGCYRAEGGFGA